MSNETVNQSKTEVQINPAKIIEVGMGFWASKTLLAANKLGLFTLLGKEGLSLDAIRSKLNLHGQGLQDFLDALFSMGFLSRFGADEDAIYTNTAETAAFLDKNSPQYIGGFLEMANDREYRFWADLEEGLITGNPQNEIKSTGKESFRAIYDEPDGLRVFTDGMSGIQLGSFMSFAHQFDFSPYQILLDVGGSGGVLSSVVAANHSHMHCISYDLPDLEPYVKETRAKCGVEDRVTIQSGNFFEEEFPKADVITMGNILHSFDMDKKDMLIRKAYDALPQGGALVVIEMILDNERKENTFGLLMSLNMLIESDGGFNYTQGDLQKWVSQRGFREVSFVSLGGPISAAIAIK